MKVVLDGCSLMNAGCVKEKTEPGCHFDRHVFIVGLCVHSDMQ